ncbi:MAG: porin family protein [Gammaproteobacteria bacterium]|nr:porin family protein [Gammaproteobacteria bacterium]
MTTTKRISPFTAILIMAMSLTITSTAIAGTNGYFGLSLGKGTYNDSVSAVPKADLKEVSLEVGYRFNDTIALEYRYIVQDIDGTGGHSFLQDATNVLAIRLETRFTDDQLRLYTSLGGAATDTGVVGPTANRSSDIKAGAFVAIGLEFFGNPTNSLGFEIKSFNIDDNDTLSYSVSYRHHFNWSDVF